MRLDKWLWCVRIFKSRTLATEACNSGKVKVKGKKIKPSYEVKTGETVKVQNGYAKRDYFIIGLLEKRISAKFIKEYVEDITPPDELLKQQTLYLKPFYRRKGSADQLKKTEELLRV